MGSLQQYRKQVNQLQEQLRLATMAREREETALVAVNDKIINTTEANNIIQSIAQTIQQQIHQRISSVVTRCLNAIFDDPYEFKIRFDRKRGKTEAVMVFTRNEIELDDPLNSIGGGVIDIASLGLRLAAILLSKPKLDRVLILDEPYKNVRGEQYKARTRQMLQKLAEELKLQIIINTDVDAFRTMGTVVELS